MNPFKNVFKSKKSASLDILSSFVRASKSASSISVETVDLDEGTSDTEWSIDGDTKTVHTRRSPPQTVYHPPVPLDVELHKSGSSQAPYRNLVLIVVAELHQILSLKLPRYMVALLSNYRFIKDTAGRHEQVEQIDLYLTNVQEYLEIVRRCEANDYQTVLHHCGKTVAVLASIIELVGRNASMDVFLLSFQRQTISAFDKRCLGRYDVKTQYLNYLTDSTDNGVESGSELNLADSKTQTDQPSLTDTSVQTLENSDIFEIQALQGSGDHSVNQLLSQTADVIRRHTTDFGELIDTFVHQLSQTSSRMSGQIKGIGNTHSTFSQKGTTCLKRLLQEIVSRDSELSSAFKQIACLKAELVGQNSEIGNLHRSLSIISEESVCNATEQDLGEAIVAENTSLTQKVVFLSEEVRQRESVMVLSQSQLQCLNERIVCLEGDLQSRTQTLTLSQEENAALIERMTHSEQTRDMAEQSQQAFLMTMKRKNKVLQRLQAALQAAIADGNDMQSDVAELKRQRKISLEAVKTVEKEKTDLNLSLTEKTATVKQLEQLVHSQADELAKAAKEIRQLDSIRDTVSHLRQSIQTLENERNLLRREMITIQAELSDSLQNQTDHSDSARNQLRQELKLTQADLSEILRTQTLLQSERDQLRQEIAMSKASLSDSLKTQVQLRGEIGLLNGAVENQTAQLADLHANYQTALTETAWQKAFISARGSESSLLAEQLELQQTKLTSAEKRADELKSELTVLQTSFHRAETDTQREEDSLAEKRVRQLETELRCLQDSFFGSCSQADISLPVISADVFVQTDDYLSADTTNTDRLEELRQAQATVQTLQAQLNQQSNVLRAIEYGKESLALRITGLATDNRTCETRIRELEHQLSAASLKHSQDSDMTCKTYETKLRDALSRLAQKGEQFEFSKSNIEKLLKRQEEMTRENAASLTLKNQAEQKIERLTDQTFREIDELELQIKSLKEIKHKNRTDNQTINAEVSTDRLDSQTVGVQTGLSFVYGYDFETGRQIQADIFLTQAASKGTQADWPTQSRQVSPQQQTAATQTRSDSRAALIQTDNVESEGRFSQTDEVECKSRAVQTVKDDPLLAGSRSTVHFDSLMETVLAVPAIPVQTLPERKPVLTEVATSTFLPSIPHRHQVAQTEETQTTAATKAKSTKQNQSNKIQKFTRKNAVALKDATTSVTTFPLQKVKKRFISESVRPLRTNSDDSLTLSESCLDVSLTESLSACEDDTGETDRSDAVSLLSLITDDDDHPDENSVVNEKNETSKKQKNSSTDRKNSSAVVEVTVSQSPVKPCRTFNTIKAYASKNRVVTDEPRMTLQLTEDSSLHDICQFVYDSMLKNKVTENVLVKISSGLDYSTGEEEFDKEFARQFLLTFDSFSHVRNHFYQDGGSNMAAIVSRLRAVLRTQKSVGKVIRSEEASSAWKYPGTFKRHNDVSSSVELIEIFNLILSACLTRDASPDYFDPQNPALKDGRITSVQFTELEDFNAYFAMCFCRIAHASRNLRLTFRSFHHCFLRQTNKQRTDQFTVQFAVQFAVLALRFARSSKKMHTMLTYEINIDFEFFLSRYGVVLERRLKLLPPEDALRQPANSFVSRFFAFR